VDIQWTSPRTTLQRLPCVDMDASVGSGVHDLNLALVAAAADGDSVAVRASLRAGADVHFLDDAALCASRRLGAGKVRLSVAAMHWSPRRVTNPK